MMYTLIFFCGSGKICAFGANSPCQGQPEYSGDLPEPDLELGIGNLYSSTVKKSLASTSRLYDDPEARDVARNSLLFRQDLAILQEVQNLPLEARENDHIEILCARGVMELNGGEIEWAPTTLVKDQRRRLDAGWYDTADEEEKVKIANSLDPLRGYAANKDNLRQIRKRTRERIGPLEAFYLKAAQRYPKLAHAIAISTISNQKDPSNVLH